MNSQVSARALTSAGGLPVMEALLAQLGASRSILTALQGRPAFGKVSSAEKLKLHNALHQVPLSSVELAQVLDAVVKVGFAAEDITSIVDTIADILGQQGTTAPMAKACRSSMQSWETLIHFIPDTVWEKLQQGSVDSLLEFLIRMGLRHPSEPTSATIALVCLHQAEGEEKLAAMPAVTRLEFVKTVKHAFKAKTKFTAGPVTFIPMLPASPAQLKLQYPIVYEATFAAEPPAPCKISQLTIAQLKAGTRMRMVRSAQSDVLQLNLGMPQQMMQFGQGLLMQMQSIAAHVAVLKGGQSSSSSAGPLFVSRQRVPLMLASHAVQPSVGPLAVHDAAASAAAPAGVPAVVSSDGDQVGEGPTSPLPPYV
jgi:hypothetical protein